MQLTIYVMYKKMNEYLFSTGTELFSVQPDSHITALMLIYCIHSLSFYLLLPV